MYDCEGEISNDANINRIYDKYVQEQMIRALVHRIINFWYIHAG